MKNDFYDAVLRPEEKFVVPSCSRWKHRWIQSKIRSMRILMKGRPTTKRHLQLVRVETHT